MYIQFSFSGSSSPMDWESLWYGLHTLVRAITGVPVTPRSVAWVRQDRTGACLNIYPGDFVITPPGEKREKVFRDAQPEDDTKPACHTGCDETVRIQWRTMHTQRIQNQDPRSSKEIAKKVIKK